MPTRDELINSLWYDKHFTSLDNNRARLEYTLAKHLPLKALQEMVLKEVANGKTVNGKSLPRAKTFKAEADLLVKLWTSNKEHNNIEHQVEDGDQLKQALFFLTKAILYTPKSEPQLLAKLYICKSEIHTKKDQHEAALYAVNTALEILNSRTSLPPSTKYVILRITALKACKRYDEAYEALKQLLEQLPKKQEQNSKFNFVVNTEELHSMLQVLKKLVADGQQEAKKTVRICNLSQPKQKPYSSYKLSAKCKIENSPVVGRHFIAAGDISSGEVLLTERPYSTVLSMEHATKRCNYCFSKLDYKAFPCTDCSEVVYCDQKCAQKSFETSHRFVCGLRAVVFAIGNLSALHVSQMIAYVGGPLQAMKAQNWAQKEVHFNIDDYLAEEGQRVKAHLEKTDEEKWRAYAMASVLVSHEASHSHSELVWQTVAGLEMAALFDAQYALNLFENEPLFLDLACMLVADVRRIAFNVFGWQSWASEDASSELHHLAQAQCLVGSLVNHSCVPNTSWEFSDEGVIQFVAKGPIKSGDEITISYGAYSNQSYESRQKRLNHYYFACACSACYSDARNGRALRCPDCDGPVVFGDQPVNKVPSLNGKCLLCFALHPTFSQSVEAVTKAHLALKQLSNIAKVVGVAKSGHSYQGGHHLLVKAVEAMRTLEKTSFVGSEPVQQSLVVFSAIFETLGGQLVKVAFPSLEERLGLALFVARNLKKQSAPLETRIKTLLFWFEHLLELVSAFSEHSSTAYNAFETELWSTVYSQYQALKKAIEGLSSSTEGDGSVVSTASSVLEELKSSLVEAISNSLKQSVEEYGPDRLLFQQQVMTSAE